MASVEEHVIELLASASLPALPWVVRMGELSDSVDTCLVVTEFGGRDGERGHALERPSFQVLGRGAPKTSVATSRRDLLAVMGQVRAALHGQKGVTVADGTHYAYVWASGGVAPLGYDANRRPLVAMTFVTAKEA